MRISSVDLWQVEIPPVPPIAKYFPRIYDITLCRIETDEGVSGIGETAVYELPPEARDRMEAKAQSYVGRDPRAIDPFGEPDPFTCALLDIAGKASGLPMHRLFGEKVRDRVPVSFWSCPMEPYEIAAEAERGARLGFANHKLKARSWNVVETVRLIKEAAGPACTIGVDPNTEFRVLGVAERIAAELEPFGTVANLEDPMLKERLDWYRLLRERTSIPIALHVGSSQGGVPCRTTDVVAALEAECVDCLVLGGTAQEVRAAAALAEAAGVPCWVQLGGVCLGVLAAYSVHLQSTLRSAVLPCDELPFMRIADVLGGALVLEQGHFLVPERPGLGVELDLEVVERYRVA
jgi:L-alanine-DL-glutamate epimerase-like enolase superfamily enzyme